MLVRIITVGVVVGLMGAAVRAQDAAAVDESKYTYEGLLALGHGQYVAGKYAEAIAKYEAAKKKEPGRPDAYYFIGCAMIAQQRFAEAATVLQSAATVGGDQNPAVAAKALFQVARAWELAGKWDKAKYSWSAYKEFVGSHPEFPSFVNVATARVAAIEAVEKLQQQYQIVRDRAANDTEAQ